MSHPDGKISFSSRVKTELLSQGIKKNCCKRAFEDATALGGVRSDRSSLIMNERMICDKCLSCFVAGLFVSFGSITDPNKFHHMEFSLKTQDEVNAVASMLSELGFPPAFGKRKGRFIAYYKKSDTIVDLLGTIGANNAMFEYLNSRIISSIKNDTNRRVNFDSANISKSLNAANEQIRVIEMIIENGLFNELSSELRETATLRIKYPEATMTELGMKFQNPISKSGVNHRMDKVFDFAKKKALI